MTRLKFGIVDLDTSHPGEFVPIIRSMGHEVTAVYDSGTIYPAGYAEAFAGQHGIRIVAESLENMAEHVDVALICGCNWDLHVGQALPFLSADKGILIDKPMAGNIRDLLRIADFAKDGARIAGGSSLRVCYEAREWSELHGSSASWVYGITGCGVDEFNYGIHGYALLHGLLGSGFASARYLGTSLQDQFELEWADGRRGIVSIGKADSYLPFHASVVTGRGVHQIQVDSGKLYQALIEHALPILSGESPASIPPEALIAPELSALAAKRSKELGGVRVHVRDIPLDDRGFDGAAFAAAYRKQKSNKEG